MPAGDGSNKMMRPDAVWTSAGLDTVAKDLYARAGIGPKEIQVAQLYENFTGQVLMAIEDFGFAKRGEGGPFVASGAIDWPNGSLPINTSGGNLAEAYIHGLSLVVELQAVPFVQHLFHEFLIEHGPFVGQALAIIYTRHQGQE